MHLPLTRALAVVLALSASAARADVVGDPPSSCPPGSTPVASHAPFCAPGPSCTSDLECGSGRRCVGLAQCVEQRRCGGLEPPDAEPCTTPHVVGACDDEGRCDIGECTAQRVCVGDGPRVDCDCAAPGHGAAGAAGGLAFAAAVLAAIVARRRRSAG